MKTTILPDRRNQATCETNTLIARFVDEMTRKFNMGQDTYGDAWQLMSINACLERLEGEIAEVVEGLQRLMQGETMSEKGEDLDVVAECADVANIAMFLAYRAYMTFRTVREVGTTGGLY